MWIACQKTVVTSELTGISGRREGDSFQSGSIKLLECKDGKWTQKLSFADEVTKSCLRATPPDHSSQRLYVSPKTGKLYIHEQRHPFKSFDQVVEIDPESSRMKLLKMPFPAEDMAFDLDGLAYLRTDTEVVRYDPVGWREVPWDYGEERECVTFDYGGAKVMSALALPGQRPVCFNMGGMWISPKGNLAITCTTQDIGTPRNTTGDWKAQVRPQGKPWRPQVYPGMAVWEQIHVWDKHGKLIYEDALPGCWRLDGIAMDEKDDLYISANATRMLDGKRYPNEMVGTLLKVTPCKSKVVSTGATIIPLAKDATPQRSPELANTKIGNAWVEGAPAHWFYGGVGFAGFNPAHSGGGCACWHTRSTLDLYARSFAPEIENFSVAVLDRNGNLILRVGQYGNEDDGVPMRSAELGMRSSERGVRNAERAAVSVDADSALRIPHSALAIPRSLGGDEVGLMLPMYVATHTDHRLFIQDAGNARVISVRLDYHTSEKVPLKTLVANVKKE